MKRVSSIFSFSYLGLVAGGLLLAIASAADAAPEVIPFSESTSSLVAEPVTRLDSFPGFTLEPQRITIKVLELGSDSSVGEAPVSFEVTSITGTLSSSLDFAASTLLRVTTDATGAATVYFHPGLPLEIPGEVRATVERGNAVTFVFHPGFPGSIESAPGLGTQMNAVAGVSPGSANPGVASVTNPSRANANDSAALEALIAASTSPTAAAAALARHTAALQAFLNRTLIVFTPLE
jgi:hypothetical protein